MQKTIAKVVLASMILSVSPYNLFADSIDATDNMAWGENTGWINFAPTNGDVDVTATAITGHAWGENTGWINMNPTNGGVTNTCAGVLGGYAWSQSMGWINFTGVTIDANGYFGGTATDDLNGSIAFTGTNIAVKTDWTPDCTAPGIPVVSSISTDTGSSTNDFITNDNTIEINGTSEANTIVEVYINGISVGTANVDNNGDWTYDYTANVLADNNYDVTVMGIDDNGNMSVQSNIIDVEIDTTAPAAVTINNPADNSVTSDTTPTVAGTGEPGAMVNVTTTGGSSCIATVDPTGIWSCDMSPALTDGTYSIDVEQTDVAGNTSVSESVNLEIDTTAPDAPTVDLQLSNDDTPVITGTVALGTGEELTVEVNGVVYTQGDGNLVVSGGVWTLTIPTALADGQYEVTATVTDAAGNATDDISIAELELDATAPAAPVISSHTNGDATSDTTPTITGSGEAGSIVTVTDGNGHTCTDVVDLSGNWSCNISPAHTDGDTPTYSVSQTDIAGNTSPTASVDIVIDTTAPTAPTVNNQLSNSTNPTITGMASLSTGETLSVTVGTETYTVAGGNLAISGGMWTLTIPTGDELSDGVYDVTATITDSASNTTTDTSVDEITIDATAPTTPTLNGPTNGSPVTGAAEAGTTVVVTTPSGATCTTTADASGSYTCVLNPTPVDGEDATVLSTDAAGNSSNNTELNAIDTTAPTTPTMTAPTTGSPVVGTAQPGTMVIITTPSGATCTTNADASGNYICSLSPTPVDGEDASILSIDTAGNSSTALYPAAIDISAPTTTTVNVTTNGGPVTGTAEPGTTVNITTPSGSTCTAVATAAGTYSCTMSPAPTDGEDVIVTTTDAAGNYDSFVETAGIDTTAPVTPTLTGPTNGNPVTGTAEAGSNIVVTTPSGATCTTTADSSGNYSCTLSPMPEDEENATVVSTDIAGNSSTHTEIDAIDTDAPSAITLDAPTTGSPVTGTAEAGGTVVITTPSGATCTTTADINGNYSCALSPTPLDGEDVTVAVSDESGNNANTTFVDAIDLSTQAPTVEAPSNGDPVSGTAEALSTVVLITPSGATCTTTADSSGNYSCSLSPTPLDGEDVTATATDLLGNSNASTEVDVIDLDVPDVVTDSIDETVGETTATIAWTTDEPTSTEIQYGLTDVVDQTTGEQDIAPRVISHTATLSGLLSCTTYFYKTISRDVVGNELVDGIYSFTTSGCEGDAEVQEVETTNIVPNTSGTSSTPLSLINNENEEVEITVPAGYNATDTCTEGGAYFQMKQIDKDAVVQSAGVPYTGLSAVRTYDLSAYCTTGEKVTQFDEPLTITAEYPDADIEDADEPSLRIHSFNETTNVWESLDNCSVDTIAKNITCDTNHFTTFGIFVEDDSAIGVSGGSNGGATTGVTGGSVGGSNEIVGGSTGGGGGFNGGNLDGGNESSNLNSAEDNDEIPETSSEDASIEAMVENMLSTEEVVSEDSDVEETVVEEVSVEQNTQQQETLAQVDGQFEKSIMVNGVERTYIMKDDYETCPIIENLKDENYDNNHYSYLLDINNYDNIDFIKRLERAGVIDGDHEDMFDGSREITRVEFLKIMMRSHCIEYRLEDTSNLDFVDTDNTTWEAKVIKKALDLQIVDGDTNEAGEKIFRGNDAISRGEAIKIALNMAILQVTGELADNSYNDVELDWHKKYVDRAEHLGVVNPQNEDYTFAPSDPTSRQNFTKLLENILTLYR